MLPLGYLAALTSAVFVGLFTVLNKWLLKEDVPSFTAAAWTYAAAGIALAPWAIAQRGFNLQKPWTITGWLLAGSVIGPGMYFLGLKLTSGVQGVLMINLEAVFTALLAFLIFKEKVTAIAVLGGLAILSGGICVAWPESSRKLLAGHTLGDLLMAMGYLGWATENNLGRLLGEGIPAPTLVCIKALAAGIAMASIAMVVGQPLAISWHVIPGVFASGALSLGLSLALFYIAMRSIGAGRTGLIFSTSTLWGVVAAIFLLHEALGRKIIIGGILMVLGLICLAKDSLAKERVLPESTTS